MIGRTPRERQGGAAGGPIKAERVLTPEVSLGCDVNDSDFDH